MTKKRYFFSCCCKNKSEKEKEKRMAAVMSFTDVNCVARPPSCVTLLIQELKKHGMTGTVLGDQDVFAPSGVIKFVLKLPFGEIHEIQLAFHTTWEAVAGGQTAQFRLPNISPNSFFSFQEAIHMLKFKADESTSAWKKHFVPTLEKMSLQYSLDTHNNCIRLRSASLGPHMTMLYKVTHQQMYSIDTPPDVRLINIKHAEVSLVPTAS
jgi:hypothetical protein